MGCETICIVGESGTGKSTSLRNLDPKCTFIISTTGKPLPLKSYKKNYIPVKQEGKKFSGNYYVSSNYNQILNMLKIIDKMMPEIKQVVIDDFQYMLSYEFVDRATETGYTKFSELAQHVMNVLRYSEVMREDCKMVFLTHSENEGTDINPKYVIKTLGKLLKEKVTLEGLFTYVFFTKVLDPEEEGGPMQYKFLTNTDGECCAKSPMGMFNDMLIDNDLDAVIKAIDKYNNE
jgi:ABC-type dipeptide/oligopeptide/nickel transport system ATPase component